MSSPVQAVYNWYRSLITNPKYRWWIIGGTLIYLLSPIDIAPDFIPFIGQLDDAVIVALLLSEVSQMVLDRTRTLKKRRSDDDTEVAGPRTVSVESVDVESVSVDS